MHPIKFFVANVFEWQNTYQDSFNVSLNYLGLYSLKGEGRSGSTACWVGVIDESFWARPLKGATATVPS